MSMPGSTFRFGDRAWVFDGDCIVMGIVNATPDSFSDGGLYNRTEAAVAHGLRLVADGAAWVDVGGESTRPGADTVPADEEIRRVVPVIRELRQQTQAVISVDTTKAATARAALAAGAHIVNDVSGLQADPDLARVLAETGAGCVLMHRRGTPTTMRSLTQYTDVAAEVSAELGQRLEAAVARSGLSPEHFVLDPGIGFAKTAEQSVRLITAVAALRAAFGRPVLLGPSRKSFIGQILDQPDPRLRLWGTAGAVAAGVLGGADIVRVHDVREMTDVVRVCVAVRRAGFRP